MKILRLIPYFYPSISYGGPVNGTFCMSKAQQKLGHLVQVLTTDAGEIHKRIPYQEKEYQGVQVRYLRNISNTFAKKWNLYLPIGLVNTVRIHVKNCDIVHIHEYFTLLTVVGIFWAKIYGKKIVLQPHGSIIVIPQRGKIFIKKIFNFFFEKFILKNTTHFFVLSLEEQAYLYQKGIPQNRISLLNNGVDLDLIQHYQPIDITGKYFTYDPIKSSVKLIYLGRLHFIKGVDLLIEAMALLREKKINALLFLAGPDDGFKSKLQKMIFEKKLTEQIIFTGLLNSQEKYSLIRQCDIYVQVSRNEPYGISIAEAICLHKPVVISDQVGLFFLGTLLSKRWIRFMQKFKIITSWDDGHPKDLKLAELLMTYRIPAIFYIPIENQEARAVMPASQIKTLSHQFEIGGHTYHHVDLTKSDIKTAENEIVSGKIALENIIGKSIDSFCFPFGHYNQTIIELVRKGGFNHARTARLFHVQAQSNRNFLMHPNLHFYPHSRWIDLMHCIKMHNFLSLFQRILYLPQSHIQFAPRILQSAHTIHL